MRKSNQEDVRADESVVIEINPKAGCIYMFNQGILVVGEGGLTKERGSTPSKLAHARLRMSLMQVRVSREDRFDA